MWVVQTVLRISRDFLILAIQLNFSDRFSFKKNNMLKVAFVSQKCAKFLKNTPKETRENPLLTLLFFGYAEVMNIRENLRFHLSARRLPKLAPPARAWS